MNMSSIDVNRNRMLALISTILAAAALRASYPVTMPLTAAMLLIAAIWPVKLWLDRCIPWASYIGTSLILLFILGLFFAALYFSAAQVVHAFGDNWGQFEEVYQTIMRWLNRWGIEAIKPEDHSRLIGVGQDILSNASTILIYLSFIALLVMLGLPEVDVLGKKIDREVSNGESREIVGTIAQIAHRIRQYLGITLLTSLLTGIASALWAFAIGLDLPLVWGILNFLLNFIPVVGNFAGIVPPTLYALIQFKSLSGALIALVGFCFIQIAISNFIYPMLQGRSLSLSPIAVVLALAFWSWVWGFAGALVAIPLTVSLVIVCAQFEGTRWIALLLSRLTAQEKE
jgi:AI-2 transport protein TqsA